MNSVSLTGRLTDDPKGKEESYARFTLAVNRRVKKEGEADADFITVVSFGKQATFVLNYFKKGMKMGVTGRIQTGSYEKDGKKYYTTDVVAENIEFCESKKQEEPPTAPDFIDVPADAVNDLPFK